MKKIFDRLMQEKNKNIENGYILNHQLPYFNYLSNDKFEDFLTDMKTNYNNIYEAYCNGNGGELKESKYKDKILPPKMASFASSSRLTYLLFKDINHINPLVTDVFLDEEDTYNEVIFEGKLRTIDKSRPNIDAILIGNKSIIFIEVKCHEIYDTKKALIKKNYASLLKKEYTIPFTVCSNDYLEIECNVKRFDLAQTIKHLIGINNFIDKSNIDSKYAINDKIKYDFKKKVVFINLFYNPIDFKHDEIQAIYDLTIKEINNSEVQNILNSLLKNRIMYKAIGHNEFSKL